MKTIVHVNMFKIKAKHPKPLTIKTYKDNKEASEAIILVDGKEVARIVYRPDKPLSCGAKCWIETEEQVEVL